MTAGAWEPVCVEVSMLAGCHVVSARLRPGQVISIPGPYTGIPYRQRAVFRYRWPQPTAVDSMHLLLWRDHRNNLVSVAAQVRRTWPR